MTATVTYLFKDGDNDLQGYVAPPPPVLFRVPYDAFYPFQINAGNGMKSGAMMRFIVSISSMVIISILSICI